MANVCTYHCGRERDNRPNRVYRRTISTQNCYMARKNSPDILTENCEFFDIYTESNIDFGRQAATTGVFESSAASAHVALESFALHVLWTGVV